MYSALIDENNNHVLVDLKGKITIFKKVKLGNCFMFNEKHDDIASPFFISFDEKTLNYHIVPKDREKNNYMDNILDKIKLEKPNDWKITPYGMWSETNDGSVKSGNTKITKGHMWIEIVIDHISFILEFQTLCFDGDTLNCYLDKIQFVAYPRPETLNYFSLNGDLHIMYPIKGNGNYCVGNNRVVYNTEFNWESDSNTVAKSFIEFIEDILKDNNKIYEYNPIIYGKGSSPKVYTHND